MPHLAVTAMGPDQPGVIAAVAEALHDRGGNVEDAVMTALSGHVAIVLEVATDEPADGLRAFLADATAHLGVTVAVGPATGEGAPPPATHLLSVYGTDQPGLLATVTRTLAEGGATIVDLASRLLEDREPPTWAMSIELVAPEGAGDLDAAVAAACDRLGVDHRLRTIERGSG